MITEVLTQWGAYALFGTIASYLVQKTKVWLETKNEKILWTGIICMAVGILVYLCGFIPESIAEIFAGIFVTANTVYALYFNDKAKKDK